MQLHERRQKQRVSAKPLLLLRHIHMQMSHSPGANSSPTCLRFVIIYLLLSSFSLAAIPERRKTEHLLRRRAGPVCCRGALSTSQTSHFPSFCNGRHLVENFSVTNLASLDTCRTRYWKEHRKSTDVHQQGTCSLEQVSLPYHCYQRGIIMLATFFFFLVFVSLLLADTSNFQDTCSHAYLYPS